VSNFNPVPKPESTKKKKGTTAKKTGTKKSDQPIPQLNMAGKTRKEINDRNRNFGKSVERNVAALTGGERTPMSGAVKHGSRNLTGDVEVKDLLGRDFVKIECKGASIVTPTGDKTFTLKKSVIDQTFQEAKDAGEIGILWVHWANNQYIEDHVLVPGSNGEAHAMTPARMFIELLELAKLGAAVREKGCICKIDG
jgi:hypothetical protein